MNHMPIITNPDYWDCGCKADYIKPKSVPYCYKCSVYADESPDSRKDEVASLLSGKLVNAHYRCNPVRAYEAIFDLLEKAVEIMSIEGPQHPREIVPRCKTSNKTLYGCLPSCSPPDWRQFGSFEYNACIESLCDGAVEPLYAKDNFSAQFWSVYGRKSIDYGYELVAITDVTTEKMAISLCERFSAKLIEESRGGTRGSNLEVTTELPRGCA